MYCAVNFVISFKCPTNESSSDWIADSVVSHHAARLAGSGSLLAASGVTCASNDFLACDDKKVADELRVVSGGLPPLFWDGVLCCMVVKFYIAAAAYAALLTALAASAAVRPFCLLLT